jgi:hypothetical protein
MRGRKPNPGNVVALPLDAGGAARRAQAAPARPFARLLADPTVDRLKPRYVDVITEYCRASVGGLVVRRSQV